jgi:hypothetical protein
MGDHSQGNVQIFDTRLEHLLLSNRTVSPFLTSSLELASPGTGYDKLSALAAAAAAVAAGTIHNSST